MKKYLYKVSTAALALAMSWVPAALAHADMGGVQMMVGAQAGGEDTSGSAGVSAQVQVDARQQVQGEETASSSQDAAGSGGQAREHAQEQLQQQSEAVQHMAEQAREMLQERFHLELESTTTVAFSAAQLEQMIQMRKEELNQEEASTSPQDQKIMKDANQVRLAVHALLASRDLLGTNGIGKQVSQIAQEINRSVATTTDAETQIKARGFWTTLFFGGDTQAADAIKQEVAQNQEHIQALTQLLNDASTSAQVKATLAAQVQTMQQEQDQIQALANQQASLWGLFSWRF